jgi:hypothetical protein
LSTDDECLYLQFATQAIEDSNFSVHHPRHHFVVTPPHSGG